MRRLDIDCIGPERVALLKAAEWGVQVRGYVHSHNGLVTLFATEEDLDLVEKWYTSYSGRPGDVVGYVLRPSEDHKEA